MNARDGDAVDGDTTITVDGDMVLKVHRAGTDPQDLAVRLRLSLIHI